MEIQAPLFPGKQGKSQPVKSKYNQRRTPKPDAGEQPFVLVQRRVFGTVRNPNVKTVPEKPIAKKTEIEACPKTEKKAAAAARKSIAKKPTIEACPKTKKDDAAAAARNSIAKKPTIEASPKRAQITPPATETAEKNATDANARKPRKKSVCFQEAGIGKSASVIPPAEGDGIGMPQTPAVATKAKARVSGTPYQTAEKCSNCRFDRLESSSYWLAQIKLAESVAKHFVSAAFFSLALESKAEPIRSLRVELKRYVARHGYLKDETEWRDVRVSYGLIAPQVEGDENVGVVDQPQV